MLLNILLFVIYIWLIYIIFIENVIECYTDNNKIENLTNKWIEEVLSHNPTNISNMFCSDGNLVGTVSREKRKGNDIKLYFDYFANLPNIKVISKKYNISKISDNVYINTAFIEWFWDGLEQPVTARMSFTFRDNCIFQLHSSVLPEENEKLKKVSGKT